MELLRQVRNIQRKAFSDKYLLATNMTLAFGFGLLGDLLEQQYEHYTSRVNNDVVPEWNLRRTCNMGLSGCLVDVILHFWYIYLDRRLPERSLGIVLKKTLIDQLISSPVCIVVFFCSLGVLEQKSSHEIFVDLRTKAWHFYKVEWCVWPLAQFINFYYLAPKYRVFFDILISLGYDIYVSHVNYLQQSDGDNTLSDVRHVGEIGSVLVDRMNRSVIGS